MARVRSEPEPEPSTKSFEPSAGPPVDPRRILDRDLPGVIRDALLAHYKTSGQAPPAVQYSPPLGEPADPAPAACHNINRKREES